MIPGTLFRLLVLLAVSACASRPPAPSSHECTQRLAALRAPTDSNIFEFMVERPARLRTAPAARPRPTSMPPQGRRHALVQFVVDTTGSVVPASLKIIRMAGDSATALEAIRLASQRWQYTPARVQGCLTRQLVQTNVEL